VLSTQKFLGSLFQAPIARNCGELLLLSDFFVGTTSEGTYFRFRSVIMNQFEKFVILLSKYNNFATNFNRLNKYNSETDNILYLLSNSETRGTTLCQFFARLCAEKKKDCNSLLIFCCSLLRFTSVWQPHISKLNSMCEITRLL